MVENMLGSIPFPEVLRIEPASSCNFKCVHCPTGLGLAPAGIMSKDIFAAIFERIEKYHFRVIVLYHGGEPFLNKNFFSMVKDLRPLADKIKTNTNGSFIDDRRIQSILDSGLDTIVFSLDGASALENDQIRAGCDFYKIISAIKKLLRIKSERGLSKPEVQIHNVQIAVSEKPGETKNPQYIVDELGEFGGHVSWDPTWAYLWPGLPINVPATEPERNFCDSVINTLTIRWNGDIVPCCNDLTGKMIMGNVLVDDIEKIWNNDGYKKLRSDIHNFQPPALCLSCPVLFPSKLMLREHLVQIISAR